MIISSIWIPKPDPVSYRNDPLLEPPPLDNIYPSVCFSMDDIYDFDDLVAFIIDVDVDDDQYISLSNSAPLINYHLTRSIPDRVLFEMMKNVPTGHGFRVR